MNRAPSQNDTWWADHQRTCGGRYRKVKEPDGYGDKKGKAAAAAAGEDGDKAKRRCRPATATHCKMQHRRSIASGYAVFRTLVFTAAD